MSKRMHPEREGSKYCLLQILKRDNTDAVSVDIGIRIQVGMLLSSEILLAVLRKQTRKTLKPPNP
jgi:hypothetical protein